MIKRSEQGGLRDRSSAWADVDNGLRPVTDLMASLSTLLSALESEARPEFTGLIAELIR
jgi:hypothetical protein